jgi:peptide/nickel transport system substrate-binding protein
MERLPRMGNRLTGLLGLGLCALFSCARPSHPGGPIRISVPYDVATLDPHARDTLSSIAITSHFYEPLVTTDSDLKIRPCLARLWESPDNTTWIFRLQPQARFHSGRPMRAPDVVYSFRRLLAEPDLEIAGYTLLINEVTAIDPLTVRIRTSRPPGVLLSKLRFVGIVPEGATADTLGKGVDGTGPYRLAEWKSRDRIRMTRNPAYWGASPAIEEVEFLLNREPQQAVQDLLSGRSQLAEFNSKPLEASVRSSGRFELLSRPGLFLKYVGFDVARDETPYASVKPNPFRKKSVREAIHLAIDRQRLVSELSTEALPATQVVPSSFVFGFNPKAPSPPYDPLRARALLREAGFAQGFHATLHVRKLFPEAGYIVREQLRQVGVELDVAVLGDEDFFEGARRREFSLFLSRSGTGTGEGSDILETGLHSPDPARHLGLYNFGGYANPEVDHAIEESAGIQDSAQRRGAIEAIVGKIMDDLPWVPLYLDQHVYAVDKTLAWQPRGDNCVLAAEIARR